MRKPKPHRLLIVPALLIAALLPEQAVACVSVSLDWWEDGDKVYAMAFVEDYYDEGECFDTAFGEWESWDHSYAGSVRIDSPSGHSVSTSDSMNNVSFGGGSAYAFAFIAIANDYGIYNIAVSASIICTTGFNVGWHGRGTLPVQDPCEGMTSLAAWGPPDPYNNDVADTANLSEATQNALTCLTEAVADAGGSLVVISAYRPADYQTHIREVWDRHEDIAHWAPGRCPLVHDNSDDEWDIHDLGYQPGVTSRHSVGAAFDARWGTLDAGKNIDDLAGDCELSRAVDGDNRHFEI